ncbi:hypothetical protein G7077_04055 [Sphingomonas piscis]|uniref:Lipoprotein n=1 Tax=Sphingomonas piscis TaxID=2714943 RepID=A0A6G7YN80_9SPHN|nr:DUF6491 family protein [Sphingomonas piscis]QIK78198.1 hypothetical protein G7077_04055 [Sphingomonas piscis]
MRLNVLPLACLALVGCSSQSGLLTKDTFAQEVEGRTAGKPQSCISPFGQNSIRTVNKQMVAYGSGSTIYVNRLRAQCPGLEPINTLIVEANGGQYCSGDRIRTLYPGSTIPGPACLLGEWTPYRRP